MDHLLEVNDLVTKFYTEDGVIHAVNGISFTLDEGESMAIVGESGSGKSVTALSIMGLVPTPPGRVENGTVHFRDRDLLRLSRRQMRTIRGREIAMIFQDPMTSLNPVLPIGTQLTEGLKVHLGYSGKKAEKRAVELLRLVGIPNATDRLGHFPHQFSGGQRQRVNIAMALSCNPAVLIADEPTTALDVTIQAQIIKLVKDLKEKLGMAIVWITHDLGVVAGLVDKVAVMYAGTITESAPVRALYKKSSHPYTLGLLQSLPKVDASEQNRLVPINGLPPDMLAPPSRCPFAERCRYDVDRCWEELPPLIPVAAYHASACWRWKAVRKDSLALHAHNTGTNL